MYNKKLMSSDEKSHCQKETEKLLFDNSHNRTLKLLKDIIWNMTELNRETKIW